MEKRGTYRPETGKRSKLEEQFSYLLQTLSIAEQYETKKIKYLVPESSHTYIIDFSLPNGIDIECKGFLRDVDERRKYELIKRQHPEIDLRFVFANPDKKISRTSMNHGDWATKVGFKWCGIKDKDVIAQWTKEAEQCK